MKSTNFEPHDEQNKSVKSFNSNSQTNASSTNVIPKSQTTSSLAQQSNPASITTATKFSSNTNVSQLTNPVTGITTATKSPTPTSSPYSNVKSNIQSQTNNVPLFHPSKINMSSTPIKHSNNKESNSGTNFQLNKTQNKT